MNDRFKVGIVRDPIDVKQCHDFLNDVSCGAANLFIGTVREFTGVKRTGILAKELSVDQVGKLDGFNASKEHSEENGRDQESKLVRTVALEYDCYEPFAVAQMRRLLDRAAEQWTVGKGLILHRIGRLELGEASIAVGISTPHRKASFEACDAIVDWAKKSVPVWKREILADGTNQWIHPDFPKEDRLVHARIDLGQLEDKEIDWILEKKWQELAGEGILKVVFQNENQQQSVLDWCQCHSLKGHLENPSVITIGS